MFKWPLMWKKTHEEIECLLRFEVEEYAKSWWLLFEENEKLKKEIKDLKEKKKPAKKKGKKNVV